MPRIRVLRRLRSSSITRQGATPAVATDDAGFLVIEALVSLALLAMVGVASMYSYAAVSRSSSGTQTRVNANVLAEADLQAARALRYPNYPKPVAARQIKVGASTYTVTRTTSTACPTQPNYDTNPFMTVTSTVTWASTSGAQSFALSTEIAC